MIKKSIYPKTKRFGDGKDIYITEKMDGSNLAFFKLYGELYIAQRNTIFELSKIDGFSKQMYRGLYQWSKEHGQELEESLIEGAAIIGEWIGMGRIKYPNINDNPRFLQFAKANINMKLELFNIVYNREWFKYSFEDQHIPSFLGMVNLVKTVQSKPSVKELDELYDDYAWRIGRPVEGFIIADDKTCTKYVRFKDGTLSEHRE